MSRFVGLAAEGGQKWTKKGPGSGAEVASRSPDRTQKGGLEVLSGQTWTGIDTAASGGAPKLSNLGERGPLSPWGQRARASALTSLLGSMRPRQIVHLRSDIVQPAAVLRKTAQNRPEIDDFGPIFDDSGMFLGR